MTQVPAFPNQVIPQAINRIKPEWLTDRVRVGRAITNNATFSLLCVDCAQRALLIVNTVHDSTQVRDDVAARVRDLDDAYANLSLTTEAAEFAESIRPASPPDLSQYTRAMRR